MAPFRWIARNGQLFLVLGLVAGFALPSAALALRPWIGELVAVMLALTAFRVGPSAALGCFTDLPRNLLIIVALQLVAPFVAIILFSAIGVMALPFAMAVTLMLSAPSVTGSPNFAAMNGHDPAPAMRLLVLGTALFPITVLPLMWFLSGMTDQAISLMATVRLISVILGAVFLGSLLRHLLLPDMTKHAEQTIDGMAVLALSIVVVGLMSEIGPLSRGDPWRLGQWLLGVMAVNLGLQLTVFWGLNHFGIRETVAVSIIAGNRNIALFLIALPETFMTPMLIFIGCYQVPMYLTPLVFRRLHSTAPP